MSAADSLAKVRAKIKRANKHIQDAKSIIEAFRNTDPYGVRVEIDLESGHKIQRVHQRAPVPEELSLVIGDAVHNLRSALDHLAWQLVEKNGNTPDRHTCFPIYDAPKVGKAAANPKIKGINPAAATILETVQPYQAGYGNLRMLHDLDIIDKHRLVLVAAIGLSSIASPVIDMQKTGGQAVTFQICSPQAFGPDSSAMLEDGTIIGAVIAGMMPEQDQKFNLSFDIAFCDPQIVKGKPVIEVLAQLAQLVDGVVSQFAAHL